jgi:Flavodoxin domain
VLDRAPVNALVIYESLTGNTRRAAEIMASAMTAAGVTATACPVTRIDYAALAAADLVVVGSWTDGVFVVGQRPGRAARLRNLPVMHGKRCAVYCTYALDPGRTLDKLAAIMAGRGADVIGGMAIRRTRLEEGSRELVARLLALVAAA